MNPLAYWTEKDSIWREGFADGWCFAQWAALTTPMPPRMRERGLYGDGFRMGHSQYYMLNPAMKPNERSL